MENKYFTPAIEDITIGYECEIKYPSSGWTKFIVKDTWFGRDGEGDFPEIFSCIESRIHDIRVPFLTKEQIEQFNFFLKYKSIDSWFQINDDKRFNTDIQNFFGYKTYNVFLNYGFHDYRLKIKADFSGGGDWDKSEVLYDGECKCINELKRILKQVHVLPFYAE